MSPEERVRKLHAKDTIKALAPECAAERCDHEDECPVEFPVDVCAHDLEQVETAYMYALESSNAWPPILWPCPTIRALDGEPA